MITTACFGPNTDARIGVAMRGEPHRGRAFREPGDRQADHEGQELERAQSGSPTRDPQSTGCSRSLAM